ncbi:MAG: glycosyltransferase family 39 protein [Armatimonadetes bacterium]|nr:glycosyltransferase family 39 protein [Armatimonadota bacterium]
MNPTKWLSGLSREDKKGLALLALVVILGLFLRVEGIRWSLPDARHPLATYHPDELINLEAALKVDIPHLQLDTEFYNYGALYFYIVSFAHTVARGWGFIPSTPQSVTALMPEAAPERAALFLVGRSVTAIMGTLTIVAVYFLGRRLYGRRAGLLAALLYAVAPLAVVHAHFLTVDVPATFFVTMALLWAVRLLEKQNWSNYVLAGVWVGLAIATKYNTGLVLIAPIVAHIKNRIPEACQLHRKAHFTVMLIAMGFAFIIGCPGPLLNWNAFWNGTYPGSGVYYELFVHSREGHGDLFVQTGFGGWYHLVVSLNWGLGTFLLLFCLVGLGYIASRRRTGDLILLSFFALYYLSSCFSAVRFARYMLPLFPVLCLFGASLLTLSSKRSRRWNSVYIFAFVVALFPIMETSIYIGAMKGQDPRDDIADNLEKTAPQGATIGFAKTPWFYSPPISPYFGAPSAPVRRKAMEDTARFHLKISEKEWDASLLETAPDYIALSNLETQHSVNRLQREEAVRFVNTLKDTNEYPWRVTPFSFTEPREYRAGGFKEEAFFKLANTFRDESLIPEDILYIMPSITLYESRRIILLQTQERDRRTKRR